MASHPTSFKGRELISKIYFLLNSVLKLMISIAITATETDLFRQPLKGFSTSPKIAVVFSSAHP